jgi:hypothetical protein
MGLMRALLSGGSLTSFPLESLVYGHNPSRVTVGDGIPQKLRPRDRAELVRFSEPVCESRIGVGRSPTRNRLVERPLDLTVLRTRRHLPQLLIFSPQLVQRRRERVMSRASGQIDEVGAVIFNVLLRQHENILIFEGSYAAVPAGN